MGNSTGNTDKKSTKAGQNDKTKERRWNMYEQKGKGNTKKDNSTTWGNKPESTGERRKIKEISTKGKTIQTKQETPKELKKIQSTTGRRWHENIPTTRCKRNPTILDWNMATKKHNEKVEWINNMTRELEEGPKWKYTSIYFYFLCESMVFVSDFIMLFAGGNHFFQLFRDFGLSILTANYILPNYS